MKKIIVLSLVLLLFNFGFNNSFASNSENSELSESVTQAIELLAEKGMICLI